MSSLTVLAAFLRREFRINISYRASLAAGGVDAVRLALFFYLSEVVDDAKFTADQRLSGGYFGFVEENCTDATRDGLGAAGGAAAQPGGRLRLRSIHLSEPVSPTKQTGCS